MAVWRKGEPPERKPRPPRTVRPFFRDTRLSVRPQPSGRKMDPDAMRILQYSRTPVAGVPIVLRDCINKYTGHECKALMGGAGYRDGRRWGPPDGLLRDARSASELIGWADVIMVHNGHFDKRMFRLATGKHVLCYYHSEPHRVDRGLERQGFPAYVIAQGHATLYKSLKRLPNIIDIWDEMLKPAPDRGLPFKIGYAPSNRNSHRAELQRKNPFSSKGFPEVEGILKELHDTHNIEVHLFEGIPYEQCLAQRRNLHFMLDEVVTGSYHRCTLEACSQGQVAINAVSSDVLGFVKEVAREEPPWLHCTPKDMLLEVLQLVSNPESLAEKLVASRKWMEECWEPKSLLEGLYIPAFTSAKKV